MNSVTISRLKQRLTEPLPGRDAQLKMAPSFRLVGSAFEHGTKAGVLILLYPNPSELHLVLMKRTEYPGVHSAQISFPGGKFDLGDKNLIETAIREIHEEIGISSEFIEVLGTLTPLYIPVSEIEVFPAIAFASQKQLFKIAPYEVDYLIEVPVDHLLNANVVKIKPYFDKKFSGTIPYFDIQGNHVWGATAMILSEFIEVLKSTISQQ